MRGSRMKCAWPECIVLVLSTFILHYPPLWFMWPNSLKNIWHFPLSQHLACHKIPTKNVFWYLLSVLERKTIYQISLYSDILLNVFWYICYKSSLCQISIMAGVAALCWWQGVQHDTPKHMTSIIFCVIGEYHCQWTISVDTWWQGARLCCTLYYC